jgi:hypothetical protein
MSSLDEPLQLTSQEQVNQEQVSQEQVLSSTESNLR